MKYRAINFMIKKNVLSTNFFTEMWGITVCQLSSFPIIRLNDFSYWTFSPTHLHAYVDKIKHKCQSSWMAKHSQSLSCVNFSSFLNTCLIQIDDYWRRGFSLYRINIHCCFFMLFWFILKIAAAVMIHF